MTFRSQRGRGNSRARTGELVLRGHTIPTPAFMPVGTQGTVKAIWWDDLWQMGYRLILANTYHLYLRPGPDAIARYGGLHAFCGWDGAVLTDSGGYQVFSLSALRRIDQDGVTFRSHVDGSQQRLTPQNVVAAQAAFRSDIMMPLDVCPPAAAAREEVAQAVARTTDWARLSRAAWERQGYPGQLFGIIQGGVHPDLREESARSLLALDLPGYAIGGLSVGESLPDYLRTLAATAPLLPEDRPRYVMGVGTPDYLLAAVDAGVDLFDCVYPTRMARNRMAFTRDGMLSLRSAASRSPAPVDSECTCRVCRRYSRGYLRHLFQTREIMAPVLTTFHNLHFLAVLMNEVREAIRAGRFAAYKERFLHRYGGSQ